jgi:RNA polymerase sigma-70 factor (ECF subfamily)
MTFPCVARTMSDGELLARYREGDLASFEFLYERHSPGLLLYAWSLTQNSALAEDVVQETFIRFLSYNSEAPCDSARAFLYTAARNLVIDERRKSTLRAKGRAFLAKVDRAASQNDAGDEVHYALGLLPPEQREAVVLKIYGSLTLSEVAKMTGVRPATATSRYRYALEKLTWLLAGK